ncbi:MAG: GNAT family N-acetyltransferase [Acidobacteriota bacterium]|nr:GNAT family N-acetyltransferase [Acidobacteriota bacterium]
MDRAIVTVKAASLADLDLVAPLFDAYRQFYRKPPDLDGARAFLRARLERSDSAILLAMEGSAARGFTQLYPSFSSAAMARIFILNDLFVAPDARRRGIGADLLDAAVRHARAGKAVRMVLSTEAANITAQSLYEKSGWKRDRQFFVYHLTL